MAPATKGAAVDIPAKKRYRVVTVGASYIDPVEGTNPVDGSPAVVNIYRVGRHGEIIELTDGQAARLLDLGVVRGEDEPPQYDELNDFELDQLALARGIEVRGSGVDGAVLREDRINALATYDQGNTAPPTQAGSPQATPAPAPAPAAPAEPAPVPAT